MSETVFPAISAASATISVVHPSEFSEETSQTSGSLRLAAISGDLSARAGLWAGTFLVEPEARTGIHHHGRQDTIVYVLEGESYVRWGELGEHSATVRAGDFLHVPAWLPHQEINPSKDAPFRWIVVRSTPEPIVVNLPDDFWGQAHSAWAAESRSWPESRFRVYWRFGKLPGWCVFCAPMASTTDRPRAEWTSKWRSQRAKSSGNLRIWS